MREFFSGWRRKIGIAALVLALASLTGWVRSLKVQDSLGIPVGESTLDVIESVDQSIVWVRLHEMDSVPPFPTWETGSPSELDFNPITDFGDCLKPWFGFVTGKVPSSLTGGPQLSVWAAPYWSLVIPLTLVSYWLLLLKPSPSTPKKIAEPTANEGA